MFSRASTRISLGGLGLAALVLAAGCEGSSAKPRDGGFRTDTIPGTGGSGGGFDVFVPPNGGDGGVPQVEALPPLPPPTISPRAMKIMPAGTDFLGGITLGCSYAPGNTRWCAFSKIGAMLSRRELWVVNMSKLPPKCDGTSPDCKMLTDDLYTGTPQAGPAFPTAHRWYGDTFIYHAKAKSNATQIYLGPVFAWAVGWAEPKQLSGTTDALLCRGHSRTQVALCLETLSTDQAQPLTFDLWAGKYDGTNTLKKIMRITPSHPTAMTSQWGAGFSVDGATFVFSAATPPAVPGGAQTPETLYFIPTASITDGVKPTQVGDPGISQWDFTVDGKKWFYMRDYNYSDTEPSGTLWTADFPTGANPQRLASNLVKSGSSGGVAFYDQAIIRTSNGPDSMIGTYDDVWETRFLTLMQNFKGAAGMQTGDYVIIKNPIASALEDATNVITLLNSVPVIPGNSLDLRYGWYFQNRAPAPAGTTDARVLRNDKSGPPCALSQSPNSTLFGSPFNDDASLTFWVDNYDDGTQTGDGMVASPTDCMAKKRKFSTKVDYWFTKGAEGLIFTDDVNRTRSTLKIARFNGGDLAAPETLQVGLERTFALLPGFNQLMFKVASSDPAVDGIYILPLSFSGSTGDAGTPPADAGGQ